ncbi:MAG: NUDIX hydrolase [Ancrocorticia sp.]|uniref:NUDIX hydrolase n=1 Tax=Ancrocorticia sp. TaxID=2593684 RepID=UPI003F93247F
MTTPEESFRSVYSSRDGLPVRLEVVERTNGAGNRYLHHRLVTSDGRVGAVVVAIKHDNLLLVRSHRNAVGTDLWELPRGAGEAADSEQPGDSGVQAGRRELLEETGLATGRATKLGEYVLDSSIYPQPVAVVLCEVDASQEAQSGDHEIEESRWFTQTEVLQMVSGGEVRDAHSLSAILLWLNREEGGEKL